MNVLCKDDEGSMILAAKIVETMCDKKIRPNIFIVDTFYKERTYNIWGSKIMKHV
jgi:hypothetical protein